MCAFAFDTIGPACLRADPKPSRRRGVGMVVGCQCQGPVMDDAQEAPDERFALVRRGVVFHGSFGMGDVLFVAC